MKSNKWMIALIAALLILVAMGCNLSASSSPTRNATPTGVTATATIEPSPTTAITNTVQPTSNPAPTATNLQAVATSTSGPKCTVLQALNLRNGPGTAYRPPLRSLPAQMSVVPTGYNPVGVPGGPWVQVRDEAANQVGWVSAGSQYVSCNIDLTGLPSVAVAPPPPPPPPGLSNSTPEGNFPDNFIWETVFSSQYLVQMQVYDDSDGGSKNGDDISEVQFRVVDKDKNEVYNRTERQASYCIFGGGEPDCNPWAIENFTYKWGANGTPVENGTYEVQITVIADSGDTGNWKYKVTLEFPR